MKKYGKDIKSEEAWDQMAQGYVGRISDEYHNHRLAVINALIPEELYQEERRIFDFGCGDAVHFEQFLKKGSHISGIDVSAEMVAIARQRLSKMNASPDLVKLGDASELTHMPDKSLDAILSFNVLAYLTDEEEEVFYREAYRLIRPGGYLIVTHSNELFDMYSLNQYTAEFFSRHLVQNRKLRQQLSTLVINASEPESITSYNVRENPLTYRFKLSKYGFFEQRQEFINLHPAPPPLLPKARSYPDTLSWKEEDKWKLMFICSTFGSQCIRK